MNGPDEGPEADEIRRSPEAFFGHEELNVLGEVDLYDTSHNPTTEVTEPPRTA